MRLGGGPRASEPPPADASAVARRTAVPERIAGRYEVREVLGRGGMAVVYRVHDGQSGRELALKQLRPQREARDQREVAALFEREFHTLTQLAHPRVIEVYDFGVDGRCAYYTMELLDGGDLRERCPVPWRDACRFMFDVCSSLALLHSRRLVHRDISPRNVRCTLSGAAKLIDFGALVPMGAGARAIGTPAFVAPEVLNGSSVDGRSDLYSLGATLYHALTGQPPYAAYDFAELLDAWRHKPPPPSSVNAEIPPALDALVMSLLSLEPVQRPRGAFEVMQRLSALAGLSDLEALTVPRAYLTTPLLVGREPALAVLRERLGRARGGRASFMLVRAPAGLGRSRVLDAAVLDAKTQGAAVLRARGSAAGQAQPLAAAHGLLEQVMTIFGQRALACARALPGVLDALFEPAPEGHADARAGTESAEASTRPQLRSRDLMLRDAPAAIDAASALLFALAREQLAVIALDDVHQVDDASCALLAGMADRPGNARLLLVLTADSHALAPLRPALQLLLRHCAEVALPPLDSDQAATLLSSLFGDVPHVPLVSARIFQVALGKPRETMELAQHLVDEGVIRYEGGSWALPNELDASALPDSAAQALAQRVAGLSPLARFIVEAQALSLHPAFSRDEYCALCAEQPPARVDAAIDELLAHQVLLGDGRTHLLSQGSRSAALAAHLGAEARIARHRALGELYARQFDASRAATAVHHLLEAGLTERATELMMEVLAGVDDERAGLFRLSDLNAEQLASVFERALAASIALDRPLRERCELRRFLTTLGVVADDGVYARAAPPFLAQLEQDSGLAFYLQDTRAPDAAARLQRAYAQASERYEAAPEHERAYPPHEAIKLLVHFVVVSIAVGARTRNARLMASLPGLLEPFVALSPLIEAMWQNAIATWEVNCGCQAEQAHARVTALYARLEDATGADLHNVRSIRNALAYCAGAIEAAMGRVSAMKWADVLDQDSLQLVNAMHIRKIVRLQQGDLEGSELYRHRAELLAARAVWRQMFAGTSFHELNAYARARDLTGVKRALTEITQLAARSPGWVSARLLAEGQLQRLRGNLEGACERYEQCLALVTPDPAEPWRSIHAWPGATAGYMQVLLELGRPERALLLGQEALAIAETRGLGTAMHEVIRVLALAEAELGHYDQACERLSRLIAAQQQLDITGLWLGASYETMARIAIATGNKDAVERYSVLTAREYRHGDRSPLGALYERLIDDARKAGVRVLPRLSEFESKMMATGLARRTAAELRVTQVLRIAQSPQERADRALELICGGRGGYLCLIGSEGLVIASAQGPGAPDAALIERAATYLREQLEAADLKTLPELATDSESITQPDSRAEPERTTARSTPAGQTASRAKSFEDASGQAYRPVLLHCMIDGTPHCAGVALLAVEGMTDPQRSPIDQDLIGAIGSLLIQAGNAIGTRTTQ